MPPELLEQISELEEEIELDFLSTEVPRALDRSVEGVRRVAEIVQAVKAFGRAETREKVLADVNQLLTTTAVVARPEYRHIADAETQLGQLPQLLCHPGDLNQVFLNLVVNAAHAIADVQKRTRRAGTITVRPPLVDGHVLVGVSDTGCGIPAAHRRQDLRPLLHHQGRGQGHRPGPVHRPHPGGRQARRLADLRDRSGQRHHLLGAPPPGRGRSLSPAG